MMYHFISKPHEPIVHSGAMSCSFTDVMDATLKRLVSWTGHLNPKELPNPDIQCISDVVNLKALAQPGSPVDSRNVRED